jgi:hypothetical protein
MPRLLATFLLLIAAPALSRAAEPSNVVPLDFEKDVRPILQARCLACHGGETQKADLDLRSKAAMLRGGETGPAIGGPAEKSLLWEKIAGDEMPPGDVKLSPAEKKIIRGWLDAGAHAAEAPAAEPADEISQVSDAERQFWAFRKPTRPVVTAARNVAQVRNPIDAFLLSELEKHGLVYSPEAERSVLLRRAYLDLTGLPPAPRDVDEFLADKWPDAYERLIDKLLASERYGERWGRHWLDLAGYADSEGILSADYVRTAAWRYRDYVIRAFNADKPYDRFLKEQIAGDELVDYWTARRTSKELTPEVVESLTATGFLRCASDTSRPDFAAIKNAPGYYYQTLDDTLKIVASTTLGLTVECAKCHSHKYDPIPQTDYYRLQAVFMSGYRPAQWIPQVQRKLLEATESQEKEAAAHNSKVDAAIVPIRKELAALQKQFGDQLFAARLAKLPEPIRDDVRAALDVEAAKRSEVQKYLAEKFAKELRPDAKTLPKLLTDTYPDYSKQSAAIDVRIKAEEAKRRTFPEIRAFYDLPGEAKTPLLRRGDYTTPGREVSPGILSVLVTAKPFAWKSPGKDAPTSGRRLALAQWLTEPDHPLTSRVLVNRLWLHHFGQGLVATPDNFGNKGSRPSHPELLDWLAVEFPARGWSIKQMHRLIMTSTAYRQSCLAAGPGREIDPDNKLLWRQRLRRLEAEALRDSVLAVSGTLNLEMYGEPVPMQPRGDGVGLPDGPPGLRRSVYLQVRRSQPLTFLQVFDQPVMETNCTARGVSTVASQALTLLNSSFLIEQAKALAARVDKEGGDRPLDYAIRLAFARSPTERERAVLTAFLTKQAQHHLPSTGKIGPEQRENARRLALDDLCHMLLSANEFAYVE